MTNDLRKLSEGIHLIKDEIIKYKINNIKKTYSIYNYHIKDISNHIPIVLQSILYNINPTLNKSEITNTFSYDTKIDKKINIENEKNKKVNNITLEPNKTNVFTSMETNNHWKESYVPSTSLSRLFGFSTLAAKLVFGAATNTIKKGMMNTNGSLSASSSSSFITDKNAEKLAETLCTMRGAALKLGQMLSIQDENLVPPQLSVALERVRQGAHVMPKAQLYEQLEKELGSHWKDNFETFDENPIAAASIGQVHRGLLKNGEPVAIKIQYPGVAESIQSDIKNLKRLITYTNILPKGLYIDEIIKVGQEELIRECNYLNEAESQKKFKYLIDTSEDTKDSFIVPKVYESLTTKRILTSQLVSGVAVDKITHLPLNIRNHIAQNLLLLTMKELFEWRFMQTDPNWSNFMYDSKTNKIALVDFGAARGYDEKFVNTYFQIVWAAANGNSKKMMDYSLKLGFLTGDESEDMLKAHEEAGMVVGEPFRSDLPFDFYASQLTKRLSKHTETFIHDRLKPPPKEIYSLHRKLAGAFLMCIKLKTIIPCRHVLLNVGKKYLK